MMLHLFNILKKVDSSNNYAMGMVHEGMAKHGMAWFANEQNYGKGQRGKSWHSDPGENIILSIAVKPPATFEVSKFYFIALVSLTVRNFLQKLINKDIFIKWPNDIYIGDKKAGGILIENLVNSSSWKWSVIGMGLNINQQIFDKNISNATSVFNITGKKSEVIPLAQQLHLKILNAINNFSKKDEVEVLKSYNSFLYKKDALTTLKVSTGIISAIIKCVDENGNLIVDNGKQLSLKFGDVEWIRQNDL